MPKLRFPSNVVVLTSKLAGILAVTESVHVGIWINTPAGLAVFVSGFFLIFVESEPGIFKFPQTLPTFFAKAAGIIILSLSTVIAGILKLSQTTVVAGIPFFTQTIVPDIIGFTMFFAGCFAIFVEFEGHDTQG